ncbi:hypothetical protein [Fonticella tunisiensis]|uniref:Uncharacterized protein n=1 Tax=Fonticella tunisiensis TaxID=1096341 RepID=A0A4R7K425_9CLOT|nr:hypothetical protein [Fonticella tunisiensis]TDT45641.1 hypothetical protein EDD71_1567 [Fonticella tunisiensis]
MRDRNNKIKHIVISIGLLFCLAIGYLLYLILWGGNYLIFRVSPAINTVSKINSAEKTGGTVELSEADVNGIIETFMKNGISKSGFTVNKIYSKISEGKVYIYIPGRYGSLKVMLYCEGNLSYKNDKINFVPSIFKVGKLKLSKSFVMNRLKTFSDDGITVLENSIEIDKDVIPFGFSNLIVDNDKVIVSVEKVTKETDKSQAGVSTEEKSVSNEDLLKKASRQLNGAHSSVKSPKNKDIIRRIQSTINKMIQNPLYPYHKDAEEVKAMKNQLTQGEKDELQNAILDNMDTSTIKQIRSTFGI